MNSSTSRRTTLITGASRGLGAAIALEQGAAGSNVAINYFNSSDAAEQLRQRIRQNGGSAHAFKADARNEAEVVRLVRDVADVFGGIDVLVVNATGPQPFLSIEEQTWNSYLDQLEFFVKSPLLLLKQVLPGMKERGFGRIINIGSEVFELGNPALRTTSQPRVLSWGLPVPGQASSHPPVSLSTSWRRVGFLLSAT